jgi:lipopolysaccharide biosynthesis glycosyltransferase
MKFGKISKAIDPHREKDDYEIAVCIGVSSDLAFAAGVSFLNFARLHPTVKTKFYLFSDKNLPREAKIFKRAGLEVEIVKYRPPVGWLTLWSSRAIGFFSPLVLSKFEIFTLLNWHTQVIWLDYDILIQQPLNDLFTEAHYDIAFMESGHKISKAFLSPPIGFDLESPGMSAGIISARDSLVQLTGSSKNLYELFEEHSTQLYFPEQAIFDIYFQGIDFVYKRLAPEDYSSYPESPTSEKAFIIHCWGSKKFWNGLYNSEWEQYEKYWLSLGGLGHSPLKSSLKRFSRKIQYGVAVLLRRLWNPRHER